MADSGSVVYRTCVTGPFPRPEELVQATQDLDRGRIDPAAGAAAFAAATRRVEATEAELGLDARTGGYLAWPDPFRPIVEAWSGVTVGPLSRWFETNTFYRRPVFSAAPAPGLTSLARWFPDPGTHRLIVPGPYTILTLADRTPSAPASGELLQAIAGALAAELRRLPPAHEVQFQEPNLVRVPPGDLRRAVLRAYRTLAERLPGASKILWTYFGDAGPELRYLAELPVDAVGFDLFDTELPPGVDLGGRAIGVACVDSTTTLPELPEEVAPRVRSVVRDTGARSVWLGSTPTLDLLPFDAAVAKLRALPQLQKVLTG